MVKLARPEQVNLKKSMLKTEIHADRTCDKMRDGYWARGQRTRYNDAKTGKFNASIRSSRNVSG